MNENLNSIANDFDWAALFGGAKLWNDPLFVGLLSSLVILIFVLMYVAGLFHQIHKGFNPKAYVEKEVPQESLDTKIYKSLTDVVPIEQEHTILMDHEYDGIRELDNNLPPWWKYGFYFCIVWAFMYLMYFHVLSSGDLSAEEYALEIKTANEEIAKYRETQKNFVTAETVEYLTEQNAIDAGAGIFKKNCRACHRNDAGGEIGPNLTDAYWLNGGDIKSIFKVVKNGKKDMPAWGKKLKPIEIAQVITYINTLQGSNPPNAKAPEGDLYKVE